tara:strand:- start:37956 stop:40526 length:2571 start_codon:yes stop_codon:yes gene_type:complete
LKKIFKIIGSSLLVIILLLITAPFLFQNQIKESVKTFLNDSVTAQIDFEDVSLSLISSFPQANVTVQNLKIVNQLTFEGETFATVKSISFDMSVKELFKNESDGPIVVNSIYVDEAILTIKSDQFGNKNYDIAKETETASTESDTNFKLNIEDYAIRNSAVTCIDEASNTVVNINALNHSGKGNFSTDFSELNTNTEALVSFSLDSTNYLNANSIKLDALIAIDLAENKYTFKENKFVINQLALEFDGFVKLLEDGSEIDLTFKNTGATFKEFLAVIPESYSKDIEGVTTTGSFKVEGFVKGLVTETSIPKMDIKMVSNNASFKYPSLPKSVEDISINASIKNDSGNPDDTYISIRDLQFRIDQDVFKSSATLRNLTKNMLVDATVDGTLNLSNISKAYPVELDTELSGLLKGKLHTVFDMNAIETNAYERTQNNGTIAVSDFIFSSEDLVNPIHISNVDVEFKPGLVTLQSFAATTGKSDLAATGTITNLLGFLLSDKNLQGDFKLNSNTFAISDFMAESSDESTKTEPSESLKIPAFLDCTLTADAKTVLYDNLTLEDVKGTVVLKDEKATLKNMSSRIFDGNLTINGTVDTQPDTPTFDMDLGVDRFDISQSFNSLELLQKIAPIAKALQGKLNSTFKISGDLTNDFIPDLNSITGDAFAELLTTKVEPKNAAVFNELEGALSFVDFEKLDLKDLKTKLDFKNGAVNVSPFDVSYEDITITVAGSHSFDKSINYNAVFEVPAKYFGNEVNSLIATIADAEAVKNLTVPVTATIGGSYTSPKVSTDLTSGVSSLTKQLIAIQKNKLINQGKDQIKDVLGGLLGGNTQKTDSTATETKNTVKDILGGFLGGKKKE